MAENPVRRITPRAPHFHGHRERLTVEELAAEARRQQIESLEKVQWAVLETSGTISFIPKQ